MKRKQNQAAKEASKQKSTRIFCSEFSIRGFMMFPICPQMSALYGQILDRLDKAKKTNGTMVMEE